MEMIRENNGRLHLHRKIALRRFASQGDLILERLDGGELGFASHRSNDFRGQLLAIGIGLSRF